VFIVPRLTIYRSLHKKVLDGLGVRQILMVIGGSMGGMHSLEWAFFGQRYVQRVVVIACSAAQSAWAIAWNEMQRSAIRADTKYLGGYYSLDAPPVDGLAAARMAAMLTYRTHESFQRRFDRNIQRDDGHTQISEQGPLTGEKPMEMTTRSASNNTADRDRMCLFRHSKTLFSAQSYLKYQGSKFNARFDANCYIALTEKLDTHDIARGRVAAETTRRLESALEMLTQPVLVIGIEGDVLYPLEEQVFLYEALPNVYLECIAKDEGHDSFLIQSTTVNKFIARFSAATCFGQPQMVRTGSCDSGINLSGGMVA
jgi:homoserine O-acetyltransferase